MALHTNASLEETNAEPCLSALNAGTWLKSTQAVLQRSWRGFAVVLSDFFVSGLSAAVVNSALKYLTNSITVAFRQRLTQCVPTFSRNPRTGPTAVS
jgi:hypothetical protein